MNKDKKEKTLSFFFATSGHSGVDRIAKNLIRIDIVETIG